MRGALDTAYHECTSTYTEGGEGINVQVTYSVRMEMKGLMHRIRGDEGVKSRALQRQVCRAC